MNMTDLLSITDTSVFVDFDGTLVDSSADREFSSLVRQIGFDAAVAEYNGRPVADDLKLNTELIGVLTQLAERGNRLVLWTNRGPAQVSATLRNLGCYASLFAEFRFRDGAKGGDVLDGVVVENDPRYVGCGVDGVLVDWEVA